ncbi:HD domain protein [Candidatus Tiddalikarchaeum anstoanum]|nr:HD domain protein [Candidatus Tiddalikarchaeum anstoanum]
MNENIVKKAEAFAKEQYNKYTEEPLWDNHISLVRDFALKLAEAEHADKLVVEVAAILHDIGYSEGKEDHNITSYNLAKEFLKSINLPLDKKELILKCILNHGGKFSDIKDSIEAKIIQSADGLAIIFDDAWKKYENKYLTSDEKDELKFFLSKGISKINLKSAVNMAKNQVDKLNRIIM